MRRILPLVLLAGLLAGVAVPGFARAGDAAMAGMHDASCAGAACAAAPDPAMPPGVDCATHCLEGAQAAFPDAALPTVTVLLLLVAIVAVAVRAPDALGVVRALSHAPGPPYGLRLVTVAVLRE